MSVEPQADDANAPSDAAEPFLTFHERLRRTSRFWAHMWSVAEFCRLIAAMVMFIGPIYVLVTWLFDFLKSVFDPEAFPDALKEWFYYALLLAAFVMIGCPIWLLAGHVQRFIWRQFPNV